MENSATMEIENLKACIRPTKQRIALLPKTETFDGIIIIPSNAVQYYRVAEVLRIGTGMTLDLKEGDLVLYQGNKMFESAVTHRINETDISFMLQGDMIGKLTGTVVTIDSFTILGDWILIEEVSVSKVGNLYLPQSALPPPEFRVVQIGSSVAGDPDPVVNDLKVGDEIYVDRSRANKIRLGQKVYFYVPKGWLHGIHPRS